MKINKHRLILIIVVLLYIVLYQWVYKTYLNKNFEYFGFNYFSFAIMYLALAFLLSTFPAFWMPISITRPSQFIYWVLYLVIYIPSMFVPLYISLQPASDIALLMLTLFAGFAIVGFSYLLPLIRFRPIQLKRSVFWCGFAFITAVFNVLVIIKFKEHMRLVSFGDVYEILRFAADELIVGSSIVYIIMWLASAFNPILMALGLARKRIFVFLIGAIGQVVMYSTIGAKSFILSIPLVLAMYLVLRKKENLFGIRLTFSVVAMFFTINLLNIILIDNYQVLLKMLSFLVFMRTFGITGLQTGQYYSFFQDNPLTYMSHVHIINLLLDYPYGYPIGVEVGYYYYGDILMNMNANFWCTDGIGGFGLPGIILVSLLCTLILWILDSAAKGQSIVFTTLSVSFIAFNMCNIPLFTSILTGGISIYILLFYLMPRERGDSLKSA